MESALLTQCPHVQSLCNPQSIQRLSRAASVVFASANRPMVSNRIGVEGVPRCMHVNCRFPAARNLFVCVHCVHVACHQPHSLSFSLSSSSKKKPKSHLLSHHLNNTPHCIFLSVDHGHLYCAICEDFVFNQFLDAAIALHCTRARARRVRFTSALSKLDPPVCVDYDASLPITTTNNNANVKRISPSTGAGGGGGTNMGNNNTTNNNSKMKAIVKNEKYPQQQQHNHQPASKKPRRLFTHDSQWSSTDSEVRTIATYAMPFSSVKAVRGPVGLFNLGNSCYMNSVLQAFLNAPPLRNFFLADLHGTSCKLRHPSSNSNNNNNNNNNNNHSYHNHNHQPQQCFACAIERLVCDSCFVLEARAFAREQLSGGSVSLMPVPFLVPHTILDIIWRNFSGLATYAQHDAHEFFMAALNLLSEHCRRDPPVPNSNSMSTPTSAAKPDPSSSAPVVVKKEKNEPVLVELKLRKTQADGKNNNNNMDTDSGTNNATITDRDNKNNSPGDGGTLEYNSNNSSSSPDSSNSNAEGGGGGASKKNQAPATSIVQSLFSGTLQSDVICRVCGNSSSKLEKFSDIQLHVDKPGRAAPTSRRGRSASASAGGDGGGNGSSGRLSHGGGGRSSSRYNNNNGDGKNNNRSWNSSGGGDMDGTNGYSSGNNVGDHHSHNYHHHNYHSNNNNNHYNNNNSNSNQHANGKDYNNNNSINNTNNCNPNNNTHANIKEYPNSLRECLKRYTEPELLGPGDEMFCSSCGCKQEAMKQMSIRTLPPIICFHFKRFKQSFANVRRNEMVKIDTAVEFPVDGLDLSSFQTGEILHRRRHFNQVQQQNHDHQQHPVQKNKQKDTHHPLDATKKSKIQSININNNKRDFAQAMMMVDVRENDQAIYDLFAVVNHDGKIDSGHYTALVRREGAWYRCDDQKITPVRDIQNQKVLRSEEAYLVFYVQRCVNLQFSEYHL